jgi:hypothetical protein
MPLRPIVTATLLAGVTLLLYTFRLGAAPLSADEASHLQQALSVSGGSTPLFFHVEGEKWLQPIAVYATALLHAAGAGQMSGRLASALVGAIDVALVLAAARMIFSREWIAVATAGVLLASPAHWMFARLGTDAIFPVPFMLLWLIGMLRFFRWDSPASLALAGASLGIGVYAHQTAPLVMAWLWVMSLVALLAARRTPLRNVAVLMVSFALTLAPLAVWFTLHPTTYMDTFGRWAILKAHIRFPLDGLRAQINWNTLSNRASLFWGMLDPSFLFFATRANPVAPLLLCSALLVPLGVLHLITSAQTGTRVVLLAAALVPPLVASTFGLSQDLGGLVAMTAAVALLAGAGVQSLKDRSTAWTVVTVALVIASVVQLAALR